VKISDYVARFLDSQGVTHVFEVAGGMIAHLIDSIAAQGSIRLVSTHHEQAAAFAADAMARLTGVPGVAMATSGPGATNLLTGVGSCYFDSTPAVFITGQVNRGEQKGARAIRQLGFQETDIVAMAQPITKAAWQCRSPEEVPVLLARAFELALSGRRGPVLVDIPMDVQRVDLALEPPRRVRPVPAPAAGAPLVEAALAALRAARRPLILAGGGLRCGRAIDRFRRFVATVNVPVVHSLMAVDALPGSEPLRVGMIGTYGNRWANTALGEADVLLVLGSRLDIRQTGADTTAFKGERVVYHVDCEPGEINNRVTGCEAVGGDLASFLDDATRAAAGSPWSERAEWAAAIAALKRRWPDTRELPDLHGINPNELMHQLSARSAPAAAFVADVGQHQMWAAQSLDLEGAQRFVTSGGMGAMGFGLPAAVGAALACAPRPVVLIAGDGGFQLNLQELETVVGNRLPIKIVLLNNRCHGMVRQFQESYFGGRYQSTYWGYSAPDFARVAQAYGLEADTVEKAADVPEAIGRLWRAPGSPALLQVVVDTFANAYPKIAFGRPMTQMEPLAKPLELEGT
jgi:acetolactate synthase I/II/III large subunit